MPTKNFEFSTEYYLASITVAVTPGAEVEAGKAVDLTGATSVNARGIVVNSRDKYMTVALLGQVNAAVKDGATITKGQSVSSDANGFIIAATSSSNVIGMALEAVTNANKDYILVFLNPNLPNPA